MSSPNEQQQHEPNPDPSEEPTSSQPQASGPPYSIFSHNQKRCIILTASLGAFFSPMSAQMYLPALNSISKDLGVSNSKINLTITTYMIVQGIAPTFSAGFADGAGRRPAYMAGFVIYLAANIGLATQDSYVALLILRALQAAGSSGMVALSNGCVGDLVTSSERGLYVAYASVGSVLGPSLAPILGGVLSEYLGWRAVFWFIVIASAAYAIPHVLFFPETCRKVVGDGTVPPPKWQQSITDRRRYKRREKEGIPIDPQQQAFVKEHYHLAFPHPFSTLIIISDKEAGLILFSTGISLMSFFAISAGAPSQYKALYGFNDLEVGFVFLPMAVGTLLSSFVTGKLVDWNYRRHARKLGFPVERNRQQDLSNFPIEKARLQVSLPTLYVACAGVIGYGWSLEYKAPVAVPLVLIFVMGYCLNSANQTMSILMVDTWPGRPATCTAASNLVRCSLGAGAASFVLPMLNKIGHGWTYTFFALLWVAFSPLIIALMKFGPKWRKERKEREEKAKAKREAEAGVRETPRDVVESKDEGALIGTVTRTDEQHLHEAMVDQYPGVDAIAQEVKPESVAANNEKAT